MRTGKQKSKLIIAMFVFGGIAIFLTLISAILYLFAKDESFQKVSLIIGLVSTSVSIILSVVATVYSYYSGMKTSELMEEIKKENTAMVEYINENRVKGAMGEKGIEKILKNSKQK